jgi:hypothetical protein
VPVLVTHSRYQLYRSELHIGIIWSNFRGFRRNIPQQAKKIADTLRTALQYEVGSLAVFLGERQNLTPGDGNIPRGANPEFHAGTGDLDHFNFDPATKNYGFSRPSPED